MKNVFKTIAESNGWAFRYGRSDFNNLYDEIDDGTVVMFLDPLTSNEVLGERGNTESINWSGSFLLCMDSSINEGDYETRYDKYIDPLTRGAVEQFKNDVRCLSDFTITSFRTTEIINSFDFNVDGKSVAFTIEQLINE